MPDEERRPAVILGGADCVWEDLDALESLIGMEWPGVIICANDIACHFPRPVHHLVSIHAEKLEDWRTLREGRGLPGPCLTWCKTTRKGGDRRVSHWGGGASGLLAVAVAYHLGCPRVVLCGVPMDARPHFEESGEHEAGEDWTAWESHQRAWERKRARLLKRTRSMSGWTRELLGPPTLDWLRMEGAA